MTHRPTLTRTRRSLRVAALAVSCIAIGGAQAAWEVNDRNSQEILREISGRVGDGNANRKLGEIYDAHQVGSSKKSGDLEPEPSGTEKLDKAQIAPATANVTVDDRCPAAGSGLKGKQREICEKIIETEKARFAFSLRMYELTNKRKERLEELEQDRSNLGANEYGKLQSNSNQLLALISLIQLDRQQHAAYMAAYDARIHYLNAAQDTLTRQALEGSRKPGAAAIGGAVGGAAALKIALDNLQTDRRQGWRKGFQQ